MRTIGNSSRIDSTAEKESWKLTSNSERGEKSSMAIAASERAFTEKLSRLAQRATESRVKRTAALTIDGDRPATKANSHSAPTMTSSRATIYRLRLRTAGNRHENIT